MSKKHFLNTAHSARDQRTIDKYLEKYAEAEAKYTSSLLEGFQAGAWDYIVTIPACGEDDFLPGALDSINDCTAVKNSNRILCLVVLNGNEAREAEFRNSNARMRSWFDANSTQVTHSNNSENSCPQSLMRWKDIDILLVDRSQQPWLIPADQGVGLVRKIAADSALALIVAGKINCPWIHATDADARVPVDYFLKVTALLTKTEDKTRPVSCFIYPYQHIPDPYIEFQEHQRYWLALIDYELWLRYYVAGLEWAESSYAYPSIGSLLAFDALSYSRIRGFPKRMAGEDFYFQNKLAKIGKVGLLDGQPIRLLARASTRVPFGTGQGTITIDKLNDSGQVYQVYHPEVFVFLRAFNSAVQDWFGGAELNEVERKNEFIKTIRKVLIVNNTDSEDRNTWLQNLIAELDIFKNLHAAETRSKSLQCACSQFNEWFDGFKTLKLIHRLRDDIYGSLPLLEALARSKFLHAPEPGAAGEDIKMAWLNGFRSNSFLPVTERTVHRL